VPLVTSAGTTPLSERALSTAGVLTPDRPFFHVVNDGARGSPLRAKVGAQVLEGVLKVPGNPAIVGFLRHVPQSRDEVVLRDGAALRPTGIRYLQGGPTAASAGAAPLLRTSLARHVDAGPTGGAHTAGSARGGRDAGNRSQRARLSARDRRVLRDPWCLGYVTLEHEGGVHLLRQHDGVMQTTSGARARAIRGMPRELRLGLLELAPTDTSSDADLARRLET
jgi:hypothetical protein